MKEALPVISPFKTRRFSSKGFTLLELLVVITIIAILAGLALMVMTRASESAKETKALNPLRAVAAAGMVFSVENTGQINTLKWPGDPKELETGQYVTGSFWGRLQPHIFQNVNATTQSQLGTELKQKIAALFPTSDPDKMTGTLMDGGLVYKDSSGLPVPFSFNSNLYKWNKWVTVNEVGGPNGIIYMTYGWHLFDENNTKTYVKWGKNGTSPTTPVRFLSNQMVMAAFLDGHVESLPLPVIKRYFYQDPNSSTN